MNLDIQASPTSETSEILAEKNYLQQIYGQSPFLVLASRLQAKVRALQISSQAFGLRPIAYYGCVDLDTSLLKTAQLYLEEAWQQSSLNLPASGMMRNGHVYRARCSVSSSYEKEFMLLPTPTKTDSQCRVRSEVYFGHSRRGYGISLPGYFRDGPTDGKYPNPVLTEVLMTFPPLYTDLNVPAMPSYL